VILLLSALTVVATVVFVIVELRAPEPMIPVRLFNIGAFRITTWVSFILGLAMFGSLGFLPLFLQVVTGASATNSGLAMFPMMGGVLVASIVAGSLITRTGRYKVFPVVGTAIGTLGFVLLTTIDASTTKLTVSAFMFVLGFGIGMTMQVMVLAAQNAVPLSVMGAATGGVSFFREIGGAIGIAVFGAVFTSGLSDRLGTSGAPAEGLSIDLIHKLPAAQQTTVVHAIADSVAHIFVFAAPIMVLAAVATWFLREVPLRESAAVEHGATVEVIPELEVVV
jgi:MFS family permease